MGDMRHRGRRGGSAARALLAVGALLGLVAAAGCGADDRAMQPPSEAQTTTSRPSDPLTTTTVSTLALQSDVFAQTGLIPDRYTCRGASARPPLRWAGLPADTVELAIVVRDLDADGFVHWVIAGIDPSVTELPEGELPPTAIEAGNGARGFGWVPPCPTSGTHRYEFKLYALALPSQLRPDMPAHQAAPLIEGASTRGMVALTGTVSAAS